jgi:hypothetical protein
MKDEECMCHDCLKDDLFISCLKDGLFMYFFNNSYFFVAI